MKKLRKAILLALALAMAVTLLAGCEKKPAEDSAPPSDQSQNAPSGESQNAPSGDSSNDSSGAAVTDYWTPADGAPNTFDAGSAVYTMDNRTPWQGIYAPPETSRLDIEKAIKADNKKDGEVKVGYATWTVGTPFFAAMYDTVKAECEKYGWTFIPAVSDADISQQVANIENFITLGVDVIIDNAYSGDAEAIAIRAAVEAGIPVIGLGLPFPVGTPLVTNCASMYYESGFLSGVYVANQFEGEDVKFAFTPGMIGHPISESKFNGFCGGFAYARANQMGKPFASREEAMLYGYDLWQQIVQKANFSDPDYKWEVVISVDGYWSRDGGQKAMEDILTAHPDIDYIFADNDEEAQGAIMAMQQAGFKPGEDILISCIGDSSKAALELIRDGKLLGLTLTSPYTWSKACTDLAYMIFAEGFDATNLPSDVFLEYGFVDKSNAEQYIPESAEYATITDQEFIPLG